MRMLGTMSRGENPGGAFRTGDFASEIAALQTQFDMIRYMRRIGGLFGFTHFMIATVPQQDAENLASHSLVTNLPSDLLTRFDTLGLVHSSLVLRRLRETTTPFQMRNDPALIEKGGACEFEQALVEANLLQGNFFPVHDVSGSRAFVALMGPVLDVPPAAVMELQMVAIHVFNRLVDISALWKTATSKLSEREIQCLTWTAAGKTSSEIAGILGLSEHTVNHYLNHVTKKLDAVNRTQAVVKALKRGLIS